MKQNRNYNKRVDLFKESPTRKIDTIREKLQSEGRDIILFSTGQPSIPPPRWARDKLAQELKEETMKLYGYTPTQGRKTTLKAIINELKEDGVSIGENQLILTAGGQSALFAVTLVLFNPGDKVVVLDPMYFGYWPLLDYAGVKTIPIVEDIENDYAPNISELEEITRREKPKALIIVTPDNPSGRVLTAKQAEEIAQLAEKYGFYIIVDEAYRTLIYEGRHEYLYNYVPEKTIALNAFSKDPGIPGWRLGFAYGPEWIIQKMKLVVQETVYCPPSFAQRLIEIYLSDRERRKQHIEHVKTIYRHKRDVLIQALQKDLPKAKYSVPRGGMFIFVDLSNYLSENKIPAEEFSMKLLQEKSVATVPGNYFSKHYKYALRLSFVTEKEDRIREGISRIAELINEISK